MIGTQRVEFSLRNDRWIRWEACLIDLYVHGIERGDRFARNS